MQASAAAAACIDEDPKLAACKHLHKNRAAREMRPCKNLPPGAQTSRNLAPGSPNEQAMIQNSQQNICAKISPPVDASVQKLCEQAIQKKCARQGIEPRTSGHLPRCASHLNCGCFSYGMHLQSYLIGVDKEKYPLINDSLVSTIMS